MATSILPAAQDAPALVPGPGSVTWRLAGDVRVLAGAAYALLLQVAHPVVGAGVADHSNFREDPWGRLLRTLDYVSLSVFGGPAAAAEIGRRTRAMHTRIKGVRPDGERYHALEPGAFAWVHATLFHAMLRSHAAVGRRLAAREREVFYADWRRVGRLVGVRDRDLPADVAGFERYVERMIREELGDNETVQTVLDTLARPSPPPVPLIGGAAWPLLRAPAARGVSLATRGLLEPVLRERLGLPWSRGDRIAFAALSAASRAATPVLPPPLRLFGPTYLRLRRSAIARAGIPV